MSQLNHLQNKILSSDQLHMELERWRIKGQRIVFTNGVFDILHRGHVTLLAMAADMGSKLVLGLNSDESVRTLGKGPDRPLNKEEDRAFVLAALSSVDAIVIFNDSTPIELIKLVKPDVLVKGGDYNPHQQDSSAKDYIVGSDIQSAEGKEVVAIDLVEGYSTTAVIKKMNHGQN